MDQTLRQFFGCYFHQDWNLDQPNTQAVVAEYMRVATQEKCYALAVEILKYSESHLSDSELEEGLYSELGCYFRPSGGQISAKAWLQSITAQLLQAQN